MVERRRLKRRYLLAEVKVRPEGASESISAVLMNINRGGVGLYASSALKKSAKVFVIITYLEEGRPREVEEVPGIVRWVQPIGSQLAAGIMFTRRVTKTTFPLLNKCLAYAMKNK